MQYAWLYLSIWNILHQRRYTALRQRGQHGLRSRTSRLCSEKAADVAPSVEQRREVRLRPVKGSTLQGCTLHTRAGRAHGEPARPTGELISPLLHSRLLPSHDSAPGEREAARTGSHFTCIKPHLQSHRLPTPECDYRRN